MIKLPNTAPCFYAATFEKLAAQFVVGLVTESFGLGDDIAEVLVTSTDMTSDIEAIGELQEGLEEVASHLIDFEEEDEIEFLTKYNPLYLPNSGDLYDTIDVDDKGDVVAIDGFSTPFVVMSIKMSMEDMPELMDGKVMFKPFELPTIHEALSNHEVVLS